MKEMKIEYANKFNLVTEYAFLRTENDVPVVRLAEVDALIAEAVWAMEYVQETELCFTEGRSKDAKRAQAFLAIDIVAQWRKRQEQ